MAKSTSFRAADGNIRHAVYLQRYNASVVRKMLALLNRTDAEIVARLADMVGGATARQLDVTLAQIRRLNDTLTTALRTGMYENVAELAQLEAEFQLRLGQSVTGLQFEGPTLEQVRAAALSRPFQGVHLAWAKLGEHFDELGDRRAALVRDTIRRGFVEGQSVDELVRRLRGTRKLNYRDGLLETSRRTTETMVRTALNHTATAAREEVYKLNDHLIRAVRWTSTLDGRTSAVCRGRDGTLYPPGEGPRPPAHPNCRSTTTPVFKGDPDPELPTYSDWLRGQDREFVGEVLGRSKAQLFLDGNLSLDRFIDKSGREYTLAELRERDAAAFKRAGLTE